MTETLFDRIAAAVRVWLNAHTCQPEETSEACKEEADIGIDTVLRVESRIRLDQAVEAIEATDDGIRVDLDDGEVLLIRAGNGFIRRL